MRTWTYSNSFTWGRPGHVQIYSLGDPLPIVNQAVGLRLKGFHVVFSTTLVSQNSNDHELKANPLFYNNVL